MTYTGNQDYTEQAVTKRAYGFTFDLYEDDFGGIENIRDTVMTCPSSFDECWKLLTRATKAHRAEIEFCFPDVSPHLWRCVDAYRDEGGDWLTPLEAVRPQDDEEFRYALCSAAELLIEPEDLEDL